MLWGVKRSEFRTLMRHARFSIALFLAFSLAAAPLFAQRGAPVLPDPGNPPMSRDQQEKLGLQAAAEVYKQMPVLPDSSPLTKYVQHLGERLAKTIPPDHSWPFQFHVVEQKEINAFALPGGPMFVNVGTIRQASSEAELAGVMAHEMAHVYMQHSAKQQEKSSLLGGLAGIAGAIAGAWGGNWGTLAQSGIQFGAGTVMLKYSRGDEAQADAVGAIIMWKADYNPVALADFFEKLAKQGGNGPQFLSDHPNPGNRREAIEREIEEWPDKPYRHDDSEFAAARNEAQSAPAYTAQEISAGAKDGRWIEQNRRNGAIFPGTASTPVTAVPAAPFSAVRPSSDFRLTSFNTFSIARPENWDVTRSQQGDSGTIAPPAGVSGDSVAYGALVQVVRMQDPNMTIEQLARSVADNLLSGDANMQETGDIQQINVVGRAAGSVNLQTISPMPGTDGKSQPEQDWVVAIPRSGGTVIVLIFVSPHRQFEQLRPVFERMLRSVSF
jgi:Zn-dependent protease with chaperone function